MYDDLYQSLFEIVNFFNRPHQDKLLLQKAGSSVNTALFPLLMRIAHHESLGIVELATQLDKDYSTVSRQVDKLISLGLVVTVDQPTDKRVRKVTLSDSGMAMVRDIAVARQSMMRDALKDWSEHELAALKASLDHLAKTIRS